MQLKAHLIHLWIVTDIFIMRIVSYIRAMCGPPSDCHCLLRHIITIHILPLSSMPSLFGISVCSPTFLFSDVGE